ncbi:MAG TPA: hypothetical protein VHB01_02690 [Nitrosospira sp.]|jgi:hypothetical protein|nr:hypothetical protein [Nitrosospira sp.]
MKCSAAILPLLAVTMVWGLSGIAHTQTQNVPLVGGQTPSSVPGGPIIGQPPAAQAVTPPGYSPPSASIRPTQPGYPPGGAKSGNDLVKEKLDRTNREAADLDRDGRISPEEASRLPLGTPLP